MTDAVGAVAGARVVASIQAVLTQRAHCRLALSGGSSVVPVLQWLADNLEPALLRALTVTWVDERHLPVATGMPWKHLPEGSNLRLAWEHWLSRCAVPPSLVPMALPGSLSEAAERYTDAFTARLGRVDVVLLGAGPDGHIASLFPGHAALAATGVCVAVDDSPKPPPQRISLTLEVLEDVDHVVFVAMGSSKAAAVGRAHAGDASIPLGRYQPRGAVHWVLDATAAAEIRVDS